VRFPRRRFDAFLATIAALNLGVAMDHSDSRATTAAIKHIQPSFAS
jgi:hypothetical protein